MCVRVSRGLFRLRSEASASIPVGLVRRLSVEPGKGKESGATDGLAQAILQERLQQQGSQVGIAVPLSALHRLSHLSIRSMLVVRTSQKQSDMLKD